MKHKIYLSFIMPMLLLGCSRISDHKSISVSDPEITTDDILEHIKFLSDDDREGRYPGSEGSQKTVEYLVDYFKNNNIEPIGSNGYLQPFEFITGVNLGEQNNLESKGSLLEIYWTNYQVGSDYIPLEFSSNANVEANIVFTGYGFSINDSVRWEDYADINIDGKWVMVFRGGPNGDSPHSSFTAHTPLRKKALLAKDNKAAGVLFINQAGDTDDLIPLKHAPNSTSIGIPVLHISRRIANKLTDNKLDALQKELDKNQAPNSYYIEKSVKASVNLVKKIINVPNVMGKISGTDPNLKKEFIVIGAHFDHLGFGGNESGSLSPDTLAIHNGADDNASGTAGVLELAGKLSANRNLLKRSILLMGYNAEEEGLLGSKYFVNNPTVDLSMIVSMINMDMIGRMSDKKITVGGTGTTSGFEMILKEVNKNHGLQLKMSPEGYGPSDHASFYVNDIPVLFFFTGTHTDYHKPSDDWQHINVQGEKQVVDLIYDLTLKLSNLDEKLAFTEAGPKEPNQSRRSFNVTFGVIPSYGSQAEGLEIDGARKDGPAANAGMQKGDVIIEISGKEIKNIYDYMYRLAELKAGQTVEVKVLRNNKELLLSVNL